MENKLQEHLIQVGGKLGIKLDEKKIGQVNWFIEYLLKVNQQFNLTAFRTVEEIMVKHFFDSWACCSVINSPGRLVDIGSGAGFPGMAIKIARPELEVILVEAIKKKAGFIAECIGNLNLAKTQVEIGRAEELGRKAGWRESFDYATCRAVAHLAVVAEYCLPLLKTGGLLIAQKGREVEEEVKESSSGIRELGGRVEKIQWISLEEMQGRCLVLIRKEEPTPDRYPRRVGIPSKRPLISGNTNVPRGTSSTVRNVLKNCLTE